jgi:uncharacterized membrane protein
MTIDSKTEAQKRTDRINAFRAELATLQGENVVTLDQNQQAAIQDYHQKLLAGLSEQFDVDQDLRSHQLSIGMRIASFLGALALAISIFFLFYQFWGKLTTAMQITILIAAPIITLLATFYVRDREKTGYFSKLLGLVTFTTFVLNITMLGQIFNVTPSDKALLLWGAFALLLAYSLDIRLLLVAGILCLVAFMSARVGAWHGGYWIYFGQRPENFLPVAILLFFIPQWITHRKVWGFGAMYRVFAMITFFIPILILANWGEISYLDWDPNFIEGSYQVAGFVFSAALIWYGVHKHWGHVVNTANVFFVIFLYTKFFDWWWRYLPKYLFFLIIALTAILFLFIFKRLREHEYALFGKKSA